MRTHARTLKHPQQQQHVLGFVGLAHWLINSPDERPLQETRSYHPRYRFGCSINFSLENGFSSAISFASTSYTFHDSLYSVKA
ncbi:hypothetical protein Mapa_015003 [Marchantia paleacea]|nr:hypothetical protein Mapa_015003 [Marchantia paleacea]